MSNDTDDSIEELRKMVGNVAASQFIAQGIEAYDRFALSAMQEIIRKLPADQLYESTVAEMAWGYADAMMEERKKRLATGQENLVRASVAVELAKTDDTSRCAICAWPLAESVDKGCVRGNCSYRTGGGTAPQHHYAPERAEIEKRLRVSTAYATSPRCERCGSEPGDKKGCAACHK